MTKRNSPSNPWSGKAILAGAREAGQTREVLVNATARDAGRNVVHTVVATHTDGTPAEVVSATRRSAHRYAYAICRWVRPRDGKPYVVVVRWSRNAKATGDTFAVPVTEVQR